MTRTLDATNAAAYEATNVREVMFVYMDFSSGVVRAHNGVGTINWGGNDWEGTGELGGISILEEGVEVRPLRIKLTLSGIDASLLSTAMTEDYHGRDVEIYRGTLDNDYALNATPDLLWSGFMDNMAITLDQGSGVIELVCENMLARYDRPRPQRYTMEDHQQRFSGDLFFEYLPQMAEGHSVEWGGEVVKTYAPGGSGSTGGTGGVTGEGAWTQPAD